ncbi:flagellar biosynthetic protein FliO [Desulfoluna sp.]|uniref:flagellar biosynthetic protein FliO n=1 Tax=Desulfoluna sp. TaxID=2045199 RepID=UPI0026215681|nr:flagellar biosynthetic protein FliO [Desulfoluna sp.]
MDAGAVEHLSVIPDVGALVLKSGGMLLVVLVVLLGCVFLLKRVSGMRQFAGQGSVTVRGTYHLGPKERIMLVDVEGVRLLLGVTPSGIQTLHTFGDVEEIPEESATPPSFFETLFRRRLAEAKTPGKESTHEG